MASINHELDRVASALEDLVDKTGSHTITIIASADDDVDIVDQRIDVYEATTGVLYGTFIYNTPTALTVDVPHGFSYLIIPTCTLQAHYITAKPSGIALSDTTVTLTYKSLGSIETFMDLQGILDAGLGKYVEEGTEVSFTHSTLGSITWEVANYNSEEDSFILVAKDTLRDQLQFCPPQALVKATNGFAANSYSFMNGTTTYYFTLTKPVPTGGQIRATSTEFKTFESLYSEVALESGTVSTTEIAGATSLGKCAEGLLNHMDRISYGSNDYGESPLRQWLNATGNDWYTAKTMFDRVPSYAGTIGFLAGFPQEVLDTIAYTDVKCASQNTYAAPDSDHGKNAVYTCHDRIFLLSQKEVFNTSDFADGSTQLGLYVGSVDADRIKRYNGSARNWWLRPPHSNAHDVRSVYTSGALYLITAYHTYGVVPACRIVKSA